MPAVVYDEASSSPAFLSLADERGTMRPTSSVGTDLCACQPRQYTFRFNFDSNCETNSVLGGNATTFRCENPRGKFAKVNQVTFYEYDRFYTPIDSLGVEIQGEFVNGDTVSFSSITNRPIYGPEQVPHYAELYAIGETAGNVAITAIWAVRFNINTCANFPVLIGGEQIGITEVESVVDPFQSVCPSAPAPPPTTPPSAFTQSPNSLLLVQSSSLRISGLSFLALILGVA